MQSLRLYGPRDLRLCDEPVPQPAPDEALVRVRAVSICHSDIHYYRYGRIGDTVSEEPLVLGHEFCGEVVAVPADAQNLRVGDLVAVEPAVSCGRCRHCLEGDPNLCMNLLFAGVPPLDGGLREYVPFRPEFLFPLPQGFGPEEGALLEPLGVALHAWDLGRMRLGEVVAIVGCGPIGLLLVQLARIAGAGRVIAVEPLAHRRALAAELGAVPLEPNDRLVDEVLAQSDGYGADVVIEAAGTMAAQEEAAQIAKRGATVVLVGIPPEDSLSMTHHVARRKGLTIKVSRRMKLTYPRATRLVAEGLVHLNGLVTHRFPLAQADQGFRLVESYQDGVVKAIITL